MFFAVIKVMFGKIRGSISTLFDYYITVTEFWIFNLPVIGYGLKLYGMITLLHYKVNVM
jgi:hypothetical protein